MTRRDGAIGVMVLIGLLTRQNAPKVDMLGMTSVMQGGGRGSEDCTRYDGVGTLLLIKLIL